MPRTDCPLHYDQIYTSSARKRNKDPNFVGMFGSPTFFSKRPITNVSPMIREKFYQTKTEVDLSAAFAALTSDIIMTRTEKLDHVSRLFPFVLTLIQHVPFWAFELVKSATAVMARIQKRIAEKSEKAMRRAESKKEEGTMFDALTDTMILARERTLSTIHDEGMILLSGGTEPTANALTIAAFHIINKKDILSSMCTELLDSDIENIETTAVVNEALRLSHGLSIRPSRIATYETPKYKDYTIPAGTLVGMSSYFVHMDPFLFPDPTCFNPGRWIEATARGENLTRFITAFGKGKLYFTLAAFAMYFDYELYEITEENIRVARDLGVPFPETGHSMRGPPGERAVVSGILVPGLNQSILGFSFRV
ncbi:cytochrome P450 [Aspergillus undulatus]|uniref:cytochrome P450 n=1 Tax=Aspergillus undulatus TaxID=1810928 RepID=UPI003CCCC4AF